jgi:hypothetical protein
MRLGGKIALWMVFWILMIPVIHLASPGANGLRVIMRVVLWGIPLLFLFAVFERLLRERERARREGHPDRIPTEPLVLMGLGFIFLLFNAEFVFVEAKVINVQLNSMYPGVPLELVSLPFGIAAVVLVASFAKAAWTHLNLEEGSWAGVSDYRERIWGNKLFSGIEFLMRVAIAMSVVLLQKQMAGLTYVEDIGVALNQQFILSDDFNVSYSDWLSVTTVYGFVLFFLISSWLALVTYYNWNRANVWPAFLGTLSLAVPGLAICAILKWIATGSLWPTTISPSPPGFEAILISAFFLYVLAAFLLTGMFITIFQNTSLIVGFPIRVFMIVPRLFAKLGRVPGFGGGKPVQAKLTNKGNALLRQNDNASPVESGE